MPSSITHAYIALDIYKVLDKKIQNKIVNHLEEYKTYSQGPDIFYFYHIFFPITKNSREVIKLGRQVHHEKTNELLINITKKVKQSKNINEFMYLIGLTTHYLADSTMHPFINYQSSLLVKKYFTKKDAHFMIETYLDNYYLKKHDLNYSKYKIDTFCFNIEENEQVKNLINRSYEEVFKKKNMGKYYYKGLNNMIFFFKYLRYDPYKIKRYCYQVLNIITKIIFRDIVYLSYNFPLNQDDFILNLHKKEWYNLNNKLLTSNNSFLELYDLVIKKGKNVIINLYEYIYEDKDIDLDKLLENRSYSDGLILK